MFGVTGSWIVLTLIILKKTEAYFPDEADCPDKFHPGLASLEYYVPLGEPYRAWKTLPWRYLIIKPSTLPDAGLGVFTTTFIAKNTWLGEFEGEILPADSVNEDEHDLTYAWDSYKDDNITYHIDGLQPELSNWLRFVNTPNHVTQENVDCHVCFGKIYYRTKRDLVPGEELLVYYGDNYAEYLDIDLECYKDTTLKMEVLKNKNFCK